MAIYHCSIKTFSRSKGQSAPSAAAYRAGVSLSDERTGEVHDYTRRSGVEYTELMLPEGVNIERQQLWNDAESSENRKNSTIAREYEIALPEELNPEQQKELVQIFARHLTERYGVAADVAIHRPGKNGDHRNYHAHILTTTRIITPEGFGAKTRVLDDKKTGEIEHVRATWANLTNQALERAGRQERVSHKSLAAQGINREPTKHLGPTAAAMERRGEKSERGNLNRSLEVQSAAKELASLEQQEQGIRIARQRFHMEKAARAAAKAEAQREAELERERQRQERTKRYEAERKAREAQRQKEKSQDLGWEL
jgi:hypothetical protein